MYEKSSLGSQNISLKEHLRVKLEMIIWTMNFLGYLQGYPDNSNMLLSVALFLSGFFANL